MNPYDEDASTFDFTRHEHYVLLAIGCRVLNIDQNNSIIYQEKQIRKNHVFYKKAHAQKLKVKQSS